MAKFKDKLEATKLYVIANDARNLLSEMEESNNWANILYEGIVSYKESHTSLEFIAFKLAIHFHIIWILGENICRTTLYSINVLADLIGNSDTESIDWTIRVYPMPVFG